MESRVEFMAAPITAGVLPHLVGRTWRWRVGLAAAAVAGLVVMAGAVAGLLANVR
ncbi:MAG: hypothetical protein ACYCUD_10460 [Candidatus Dormibacteria bacterium]